MAKKTKKKEKYITERISKAGTHSYEICIRAYDQTFRKSVKISDFDTPSQAMAFACQLRDENLEKMRKGYTVSNFKTVEQLYQKTFELFPVRVKTRMKHDIVYRMVIQPYSDLPIDKIKSADIQKTINEYARNHCRKDTSRVLTIWRRMYKVCALLDINIIDRTIAVIIPDCAESKSRGKEISQSDLQTFCEALLEYNSTSLTGSYRSKAIFYGIQIMKFCGLRPSETFALLKSDINLIKGHISITKASRSTQESILDISKTKTSKSVRNVPIPPELRPILQECLQWSRNEILLADFYGNLMDIDDIDTLIRNVRKKAKVDFTLYMLRHQFSTDLMSEGTPPNIIRDLMGHESASMSLDYAVSNEKDRIKAISERKFS